MLRPARAAVAPAMIARRRELGIDLLDEVWDGEYVVAPGPSAAHALVERRLAVLLEPAAGRRGLVGSGPFNLGTETDFRVPDGGFHRSAPQGVYVPSAAIVVEVLSPGDRTYEKFGFYAAHQVDEIVVADVQQRRVECCRRSGDGYRRTARSGLLGLSAAEMTQTIDWP